MIEIYGRAFRRQEQQRPWWWTGLLVLGILAGLFWATLICYNVGRAALWCLQSQAPEHQLPAARLVGLTAGLIALAFLVKSWRSRLFLEGPVRDLAVTPGSAFQVFKVALRIRWWHVASVPAVLLSVGLTPWFMEAFAQLAATFAWASVDDARYELPADLFHHGRWVLGFLSAVLTVLLLHGVFSATAIAVGFVLSAVGLGGVAPRSPFLDRLFHYGMVLAAGIGVASVLSTTAYWMSTDLEAPQPGWWRVGCWCHEVLSGEHPLSEWVSWFPGVALGDILHGLTVTERNVAPSWFHILVWGAAAAGLAALFFHAGYSARARAGYDRVQTSVAPADAGGHEHRFLDPDRVNGPIEALFIAWLGRMGRAVLRIVSANVQSGAVDYLLVRTLLIVLCSVLLGHAAMWLVPAALNAILTVYRMGPLGAGAVEGIRTAVALLFLIGLSVYCLVQWGGPKMWQIGARAYAPDAQSEAAAGSWGALFRKKRTATRGDRRYPLIEIYAVGFSDAVLLPTLYAGFWILVTGTAVGLTGVLYGLTPKYVGWTVAIGVPALWQLSFLSYIGGISNYWMHYSRSLLIQIFTALWMGVLMAVGAISCVVLIVVICKMAYEAGYPGWIPWLGSLNILVVADVAFYMIVRWVYVRRRFDAEFRNPAAWG